MPFPTEPSHHLVNPEMGPAWGRRQTSSSLETRYGFPRLPLSLLPFLIFSVYLYLQVYAQQFYRTSVQVCILSSVKRTLYQSGTVGLFLSLFELSLQYAHKQAFPWIKKFEFLPGRYSQAWPGALLKPGFSFRDKIQVGLILQSQNFGFLCLKVDTRI